MTTPSRGDGSAVSSTDHPIRNLIGLATLLLVLAAGSPGPERALVGSPGFERLGQGGPSTPIASPPAGPKTHIVAPGENLSLVAMRHGLTAAVIARANGLTNPHFIRVGQRLTIPGAGDESATHRVRSGDTLWDLSRRFGVSAEAIARANGLRNPSHVRIGQVLVIPRGKGVAPAIGVQFIWPVAGRISSPFGPRWGRLHTGLDIAAPTGTPIRAAAAGVVTTSRWLAGYGRTVILRHEDRTLTLYAHASKLLVRSGQTVEQGQIIARVGSSGNSTGPHLHFEVIVHGRPRDPLAYLRGQGRASVPAP